MLSPTVAWSIQARRVAIARYLRREGHINGHLKRWGPQLWGETDVFGVDLAARDMAAQMEVDRTKAS